MKKLLSLLAVASLALSFTAHAAEDAKAKTLKGDERKAFMSECLKK